MEKQGSIFQEMAERRSRCEELKARAVDQGLAVSDPVVSTGSQSADDFEIEPKPAFEMEELTPAAVPENEIREEVPEPVVENLDTEPDFGSDEVSAETPSDQSPNYFDQLDESATVDRDVESIEDPLAAEPEEESLKEEEASPSYFETIDEAETDVAASLEDEQAALEPEPEEALWESEEAAFGDVSLEEPALIESDATTVDSEIESAAAGFGELDEPVFEEPAPVGDEAEEAFVPEAESEVDLEAESADHEADVVSPPAGRDADLQEMPVTSQEGESGSSLSFEANAAVDADTAVPPEEPVQDLEPLTTEEAPETVAEESVSVPETEAPELTEPVTVEREFEEPVDKLDESEQEKETPPVASEDLIGESEDLLGDAPEPIADAEVRMVAEELVDRIGPVVDIQNLPKTQPSRVLSKTTKPKQEESAPAESEPAKAEPPKAETQKDVEKASPEEAENTSPPKKKKKKVSLLDSYFKGL